MPATTSILLLALLPAAGAATPAAAPVTAPAAPAAAVAAPATPAPGARVAPYLELGKEEAVRWRQWGPEALREAEERGKLILVDLGAMWCHYCRVMSATTYRDPKLAETIERWYVPIKVDRDQMPQLDARLQAAMLKLTGVGGWPLTAFLTDQGRMFSGGTYFPAGDTAEGPGLVTVARRYGEEFQDDRRKVHNVAEETASALVQSAVTQDQPGRLEGVVSEVAAGILADADPSPSGGFGNRAKFPETAAFRFALARGARGDQEQQAFAARTLDAMANGGIRDRLAGGFHRATVDREWLVPRFEKLLSVNAGALLLYAEAYGVSGEERYRRIAEETLDYLLGTLADREAGGFYAAQAADLEAGDDGSTYTWTLDEAKAALDGDAEKIVVAYYQLRPLPGVIAGAPERNLLSTRLGIDQAARFAELSEERARAAFQEGMAALKRARKSRPEPPVDTSEYGSLNGLAAGALLQAAPRLGRADARAQALRTLDRFLALAFDPERGFARGLRDGARIGDGLLQDQVYLADALLDAYQASGEKRYLEAARRTLEIAWKRFGDPQGGLFDLPEDGPRDAMFVIPARPVQDTLMPGENAVAGLAAERLARLTGELAWKDRAHALGRAFAGSARRYGPNGATYAALVDRLLEPPPTVIVVGGGPGAEKLAAAALAATWTGVALARVGDAAAVPPGLKTSAVEEALKAGEGDFALVLTGVRLIGVARTPEQLAALLGRPPLPAATPAVKEPAAAADDGQGDKK